MMRDASIMCTTDQNFFYFLKEKINCIEKFVKSSSFQLMASLWWPMAPTISLIFVVNGKDFIYKMLNACLILI